MPIGLAIVCLVIGLLLLVKKYDKIKSNAERTFAMKLNVISFNIRNCDDKDGHSVAERAPRAGAVISKYNPDIICLQEYKAIWEPYITEYFENDYEIYIKFRDSLADSEATPMLWRKDKFDCIKKGYFWLSDTPEVESRGWDELYNCYRICLYAVLKDKQSGKTFTVLNTHYGFGDKGQVDSSRLIFEYIQKISNFKTFVVGDFNMTSESKGYAAMTENLVDLNSATSKDEGITYHGYNPEKIDNEHIDFCFIDKDIKPINQTILRDTFDGKFPSDHYPLFIELEI